MSGISSPGPIRRAATLLFYGWGYNFYRLENQLRADDLLIRSKVCDILTQARAHLKSLEGEYRRVHLPQPTRDAPFPDRETLEQARRIERCGNLVEAIATTIRSAAAPADDFVWRRHRSERGILETLERIDVRLVDEAVMFHDHVVELDQAAVSGNDLEATFKEWLRPLRLAVDERKERLTLMV